MAAPGAERTDLGQTGEVTAAGRKPRVIIQTASTISCTASGTNSGTWLEDAGSTTAYMANKAAAA